MSNYIKNLLSTSGWKSVEEMIVKGIQECKSEKIDESLDGDNYKTVALANQKAAERMQAILNKVKLAGGSDQAEKISYK